MKLSVREITAEDIVLIADYWYTATPEHLLAIGVDINKMSERADFEKMLEAQVALPYNQKKTFALIWEADGVPVGHCNLNPVQYGEEAFMHLHIWNKTERLQGMGSAFVQMSIPYFFKSMNLKRLFCQPNAQNEAPNRTLQKTGFKFVKEYTTIPGSITFEQTVKLWEMQRPENI